MRELLEYQGRIKPAVGLVLKFAEANPSILAIQDVVYCLQMATYWLREASDMLFHQQENDELVSDREESDRIIPPPTPTPSSDNELLVILFDMLEKLSHDIYEFSERGMNDKARTYILNAMTRVNEGKYSVVISNLQYERLQSARSLN